MFDSNLFGNSNKRTLRRVIVGEGPVMTAPTGTEKEQPPSEASQLPGAPGEEQRDPVVDNGPVADATTVVPATDLPRIQSEDTPTWLPELHTSMEREKLEKVLRSAFVAVEVDHVREASPKIARVVALLGKLIREHKPTYKAVAELLFKDMPVDVPRKTFIKLPDADRNAKLPDGGERPIGTDTDGTYRLEVREGPRSKQSASRYYFLACMYAGIVDPKKDKPHPRFVKINGTDYATPVDALLGRETITSVYNAWHNIVRPSDMDLRSDKEIRAAFSLSKQAAPDLTVVVRKFDEKKNGDVRKSIPIVSNKAATYGTVIGLMNHVRDKYPWSKRDVIQVLECMGYTVALDNLEELPERKPRAEHDEPDTR